MVRRIGGGVGAVRHLGHCGAHLVHGGRCLIRLRLLLGETAPALGADMGQVSRLFGELLRHAVDLGDEVTKMTDHLVEGVGQPAHLVLAQHGRQLAQVEIRLHAAQDPAHGDQRLTDATPCPHTEEQNAGPPHHKHQDKELE